MNHIYRRIHIQYRNIEMYLNNNNNHNVYKPTRKYPRKIVSVSIPTTSQRTIWISTIARVWISTAASYMWSINKQMQTVVAFVGVRRIQLSTKPSIGCTSSNVSPKNPGSRNWRSWNRHMFLLSFSCDNEAQQPKSKKSNLNAKVNKQQSLTHSLKKWSVS